jgi:hypothetical protein
MIRPMKVSACAALSLIILGSSATVSSAHNNRWLFPPSQVLVRQSALTWTLKQVFAGTGIPVSVRCRGLNRARMQGGGFGYHHIRCLTSVGRTITYHFNARGRVIRTRSG